ncbi:MAG: N-acetylmuramoyl-L-alanine amidase, partial [Calditrichota bacterium]
AIQPNVQFPVKVTLTPGALRTDPQGAYYLFADSGVSGVAWDWKEGYWKIALTSGRFAWASHTAVKNPVKLTARDWPVIWKVDVCDSGKWVEVILPLKERILYRMTDDPALTRLTCDLFGVTSHIDQMNFQPGTELVRQLTWDQPGESWLRLEISLNKPCWGYKTSFRDGNFIISLRKPLDFKRRAEPLIIALDAGHGGELEGALGPTRLKEKDVNLSCAIALEKLLVKKGFSVLMLRGNDVSIPLNQRVSGASTGEADILISIHHNALPDGVNPFGEWGVGTRFYYPHSRGLAEAVQTALVKELQIFDEGVYYHNLALVRPTTMPAILIEAGYIMLPEQEAVMKREDYPDRLAGAIYSGLKRFLQEYEVNQR